LLLVDIVGRREISGEFKASAVTVQFIVRTGAVGPVPHKYGVRENG
jgi:hypothetical protein